MSPPVAALAAATSRSVAVASVSAPSVPHGSAIAPGGALENVGSHCRNAGDPSLSALQPAGRP